MNSFANQQDYINDEVKSLTVKEDFFLRRTDHEAILASGQPTCTGCRPYRRQENEAVEKKETVKRRMPESNGIGSVFGYRKLRLCLGLFEHASRNDEVDVDDEEKTHRLRWCRRDFRRIAEVTTRALLLGIALLVTPGIILLSRRQEFFVLKALRFKGKYLNFTFLKRKTHFGKFTYFIKCTYNQSSESNLFYLII